MSKRFSWLGVLMIAIISGLIVKVVGDPITAVTTPQIKHILKHLDHVFEDLGDTLKDVDFWKK